MKLISWSVRHIDSGIWMLCPAESSAASPRRPPLSPPFTGLTRLHARCDKFHTIPTAPTITLTAQYSFKVSIMLKTRPSKLCLFCIYQFEILTCRAHQTNRVLVKLGPGQTPNCPGPTLPRTTHRAHQTHGATRPIWGPPPASPHPASVT